MSLCSLSLHFEGESESNCPVDGLETLNGGVTRVEIPEIGLFGSLAVAVTKHNSY